MSNIDSVISVAGMARKMSLSPSRVWQLIGNGFLLPPLYSIQNRKPFYTEEMVQRNLEYKRRNVGMNHKIILFYPPRQIDLSSPVKRTRIVQQKKRNTSSPYQDLLDTLKSLGIEGIHEKKIALVVSQLFPTGTAQVDPDELVRTVFRYLKHHQHLSDNVGGYLSNSLFFFLVRTILIYFKGSICLK
jgi:hypothetical protein